MSQGMVIIGAGMAGHRAVISMRACSYDGPITVIGDELLMPYDRPPLSKAAITDAIEPLPVWLMDEDIAASLKADVRMGVSAAKIDPQAKSITVSTGETIAYEKLLIATGAAPRQLNCLGSEHALLLRNFNDATTLRERFQPRQKVVIIGGGFIGLELASSASKRGCEVTLIEAQPRILMRGVPEAIARIVHDRHAAAGVRMMIGVGIHSLTATTVHLTDSTTIPADTIVAGIGAAPRTTLAANAGLTVDNGVAVDETLRTSNPDIYAAGDCCSFPHAHYERRVRLEAWRNAQDQGNIAAENMIGANKPYRAIPWFWSDQYDLSLQIAGIADAGPVTVTRNLASDSLILFHLTDSGKLMGASGIGPGNAIARDIKLAEMMIAKSIAPEPSQLADSSVQLKALLKG